MAWQRWWVLAAAMGMLFSAAACAGEGPIPSGRRSAVVQVVEKAKTAVVNIQSERVTYGNGVAGQSTVLNRANGMGTGIVVDPRGYIITNHHVVDEVASLRVRLADGTSVPASVLAKDKEKDLAIIKITTSQPLSTLPLGTSSDLMTGETVIAIGNAFGYEHTVSVGIISHLHRDVTLNREVSYKALIQTDASINPGNSGGPLLNIDGELIGMNVAIRAGAQGISFALPIDQVLQGVSEMLAKRRQPDLQLGFSYKDVINVRRDPLHMCRIASVQEESVAARAGLRSGDQIVQVADRPVRCGLDLEQALCERQPQEKLSLKLLRQGKEIAVELPLQTASKQHPILDAAWRRLGLRLGGSAQGGLQILEVRLGSPANKAGIQVGDVLAGLHLWETTQLEHVAYVLNHAELQSFAPLKFHIYRNGQLHRGSLVTLDE